MSLKQTTARTLKWNTIDRVATQLLYALVGIVLANVLTPEDFGLVGALLVFQAFGTVITDSGFGAALLQKRNPDDNDYSTVFWFNLAASSLLYLLLALCAPLIADIFQGDRRLIPLSRVMFLTLVVNGLGIVQTNRLMKRMDVRHIAISNTVGLTLGGIVGIWSALSGHGPWALVWQSMTLSCVKTGWLWVCEGWRPLPVFSRDSLRHIIRLGGSVFTTSMLNTAFLYAYSFVTGAWYSLTALGIYTQADKWSKMGSASISQILTASFIPLLARVQDDREAFHRYMERINRMTAFLVFPLLGGLATVGEPLFHTLFGGKWDAAIPLFRILCLRGILVVWISLCCNYLLALGHGRRLIWVEAVKDGTIALAILCTIRGGSLDLLVWGQMCASLLTIAFVAPCTASATGYGVRRSLRDMSLYAAASVVACAAGWGLSLTGDMPAVRLAISVSGAVAVYLVILQACRSRELRDCASYLTRKGV